MKNRAWSSFLWDVYVHWEAKYSEMVDFWFLSWESLLWSLVFKYSMRSRFLHIHSCSCCLRSKVHRNILVMQHSFWCFHDCSVISFFNPILLRIIWSAKLPLNLRLSAEFLEFFEGEFFPIMWPQILVLPFSLVLDQGFIFLELTENFTFLFQELYPSLTWEIFYKGNIVQIPA